MKIIAHRGASLRCQENSVEGLCLASRVGASAVECDIQRTKDGVYILFHDPCLNWRFNDPRTVSEMTYDELYQFLETKNYRLATLEELFAQYHGDAVILLDINLGVPTEEFFRMVRDSGQRVICGLGVFEAIEVARKVFPVRQILAFIPPAEKHRFGDYYNAGAGIIRLWEDWLGEITPAEVKSACPDAQVYIMSNDPVTGMDGNPDSLRRLKALGADGVLLNDIEMAMKERLM